MVAPVRRRKVREPGSMSRQTEQTLSSTSHKRDRDVDEVPHDMLRAQKKKVNDNGAGNPLGDGHTVSAVSQQEELSFHITESDVSSNAASHVWNKTREGVTESNTRVENATAGSADALVVTTESNSSLKVIHLHPYALRVDQVSVDCRNR